MSNYYSSYEFTEISDSSRGFADREPSLWRAVITQALMDAASNSAKPEALKWKMDAMIWLAGNSEDFVTVCEHAGLDAGYVRENAARAIARGCVWRLPAGQGWRTQNDNKKRNDPLLEKAE